MLLLITATHCRDALGLNWETEQFTEPQLKDSNTRGQETAQKQGGCNLSDRRVEVIWITLLFIIFGLSLSCLRICAGWGQPHAPAWAHIKKKGFCIKKRKQITQTFHEMWKILPRDVADLRFSNCEVELSIPYHPCLCFLTIKVLLNQLRKWQSEILALTQERSGLECEWFLCAGQAGLCWD